MTMYTMLSKFAQWTSSSSLSFPVSRYRCSGYLPWVHYLHTSVPIYSNSSTSSSPPSLSSFTYTVGRKSPIGGPRQFRFRVKPTPSINPKYKNDKLMLTMHVPGKGTEVLLSHCHPVPTLSVPLSRFREPDLGLSLKSPEIRALAQGYSAVANENRTRRFWISFEGKGLYRSTHEVEQILDLSRPDCNARVLEFAAFVSPSQHAILIDPMDFMLWIGDMLRPTDPDIFSFLNIAIFPDRWDIIEAPEYLWTVKRGNIDENTGRSSREARSYLETEHRHRINNLRHVVDYGISNLAQNLTHLMQSDPKFKSPVIIIDHAGIYAGSQYGLDIFEMLDVSLTKRILSMFPGSRVIYNHTAPTINIVEDNLSAILDESEEWEKLWMADAPDVAKIRLDPTPIAGPNPSTFATEVFRIMWQRKYLSAILERHAKSTSKEITLPDGYLNKALEIMTPALGSHLVDADDLHLLAIAIVGLSCNHNPLEMISYDKILLMANNLFGSWMSESDTTKRLKSAKEKDISLTEKLRSNDESDRVIRPSSSGIISMFQSSSESIPVINPESITVTLDDVIGQEEAKRALEALITLPMRHPEQFNTGVLSQASASGILMYGPPGTGKTMMAKAIAKSAEATFISVNPSDVQDKFVGESEKYIKRLFETARRKAPCIIFLDEVDALFSKREFDLAGWRRDILNEFCMQWDGMKSSKNVILLGATNRPFDLDEAVIRRFSRRVLVDLPTQKEKRKLLVKLLELETLKSSDIIDSYLLPKLTSYSASDIKNLCISAAMTAVRESPNTPRILTQHHFEIALKEVRPSVNSLADSILKLREFASSFELNQGSRRLGFVPDTTTITHTSNTSAT